MTRRAWAAACLAAGLLAGCGLPSADAAAPPPEVTVGSITFRLVSGGVKRSNGQLQVWLSDQLDTCAAVANTPAGVATFLVLQVAPPTAGPQAAAVVGPKPIPAAGEAIGYLTRRRAGVEDTHYDAADGSLAWTGGVSGAVVVDAIDVGFAGVGGRILASGLRLTTCS